MCQRRLSEPPFSRKAGLQDLPLNSALNCGAQDGENVDPHGVQQRLWPSIKHSASYQPDLGYSRHYLLLLSAQLSCLGLTHQLQCTHLYVILAAAARQHVHR